LAVAAVVVVEDAFAAVVVPVVVGSGFLGRTTGGIPGASHPRRGFAAADVPSAPAPVVVVVVPLFSVFAAAPPDLSSDDTPPPLFAASPALSVEDGFSLDEFRSASEAASLGADDVVAAAAGTAAAAAAVLTEEDVGIVLLLVPGNR
jgi:hypothetical protein